MFMIDEKIESIPSAIPTVLDVNENIPAQERLSLASKTLKHNLKAIKSLDKKTSNKFLLPIQDEKSFREIIQKPFAFLYFNSAKFSAVIEVPKNNALLDKYPFEEFYDRFKSIKEKVKNKIKFYEDEYEKTNKIRKKLEYYKAELKHDVKDKVRKFKNDKYGTFIIQRALDNIEMVNQKIKEAEKRMDYLRKRVLVNDLEVFLKRYLELTFGKNTTQDIMNDFVKLSEKHAGGVFKDTWWESEKFLIAFLSYAMLVKSLISDNLKDSTNFTSPVIVINSKRGTYKKEDFANDFLYPEILKLVAGHAMLHIIEVKAYRRLNLKENPEEII